MMQKTQIWSFAEEFFQELLENFSRIKGRVPSADFVWDLKYLDVDFLKTYSPRTYILRILIRTFWIQCKIQNRIFRKYFPHGLPTKGPIKTRTQTMILGFLKHFFKGLLTFLLQLLDMVFENLRMHLFRKLSSKFRKKSKGNDVYFI